VVDYGDESVFGLIQKLRSHHELLEKWRSKKELNKDLVATNVDQDLVKGSSGGRHATGVRVQDWTDPLRILVGGKKEGKDSHGLSSTGEKTDL
jgi:hypothetical protein